METNSRDKIIRIASPVISIILAAALLYLTWGILGKTLPMWAKILCSFVAILISGVCYMFISSSESQYAPDPSLANPCPRCGSQLKYKGEVRAGEFDDIGSGGYGTRTALYESAYKCRKCGYLGPSPKYAR